MLDIAGVGLFRDGTALGRRLGMGACSDSIKGAFDYRLFVVFNLDRRYAQALNTPSSWLFLYRCRCGEIVYPPLLRPTSLLQIGHSGESLTETRVHLPVLGFIVLRSALPTVDPHVFDIP